MKPSIYHNEGYTCAEALIKSYNEEHNENIPISLGSGMGLGITVGSLCGAVNAGIVIIGYLKGRDNTLEKNEARKYSKELMIKIREKFSSEICVELKKNKIQCGEIIDFVYDEINKI